MATVKMRSQQCLRAIVMMVIIGSSLVMSQVPSYNMDEYATCGRTLNVDDLGIRLIGRGNAAPSNPPLECIVYLRSVYARDDGSNKLQIKVESLSIKDCNVKVDLYNGRMSVGQTLQAMSCQYSSTSLIYSTGREITVRFSRPDKVVFNEYQFTLEIKPFTDKDILPTQTGVDVLSVGAIIGIIIGCLLLIALIILFLWCCCTGRLRNFNVPGLPISKAASKDGMDSAVIKEKTRPPAVNFDDPNVWNTVNSRSGLYQKGAPRGNIQMGRRFESERDNAYVNYSARNSLNRRSGLEYEPYDKDRAAEEKRKIEEEMKEKERKEAEERWKSQRKETLIDDVFDSESAAQDSMHTDDDSTLLERPPGSPKTNKNNDRKIPEELDIDDSHQMQRYLSSDFQSQPDLDTISSQLHVNGGIRASVEDIQESPSGSLRKKKGEKSPKLKHKGDGREPDPMALPPEAFEPIFNAPITGMDYRANQPQYGAAYPGTFMPYGLIPAGAFAPGPPGSQTYAYAYQTAPVGSLPGQPYTQGAYVIQNTPTTDGNRRTAYAVEETVSPNKSKRTPESHRKKAVDPFRRIPVCDSDRSQHGERAPDWSVIARGAAPPDPGQNHRSIAMKSGTDPDSGIHTTQVLWTDTMADPTDPKPNENPQITRKNITRVTTKSGYGELPPQPMLLALDQDDPAFLSPSMSRSEQASTSYPAIMPSATPDGSNVAFYTGDAVHHTVAPPERTSTPTSLSLHKAPAYSSAIRDRIPLDDSTV